MQGANEKGSANESKQGIIETTVNGCHCLFYSLGGSPAFNFEAVASLLPTKTIFHIICA